MEIADIQYVKWHNMHTVVILKKQNKTVPSEVSVDGWVGQISLCIL